MTDRRTLRVDALSRVEGEGGLRIRVDGGRVRDLELRIFEPPRFFEAMLRGRGYAEPPDLTARICGICPVAYQVTACRAIEDACGVRLPDGLADLRRLLYCGEWISSHALHVYLLHAPDFLGYSGGVEMATNHRGVVERGLALKKAGNELIELIGGRAIHPVNVRLGGFYRLPDRAGLRAQARSLRHALDLALATVEWVAGFDFPGFDCDHELLALVEPGRYAIDTGTPQTDRGLRFHPAEMDTVLVEEQVPHSTALRARLAGRGGYVTGPAARFAASRQWLSPLARQAATAAGLDPGPAAADPAGSGPAAADPAGSGFAAGSAGPWRNPYRSIVVRAVEIVYAIEEALRLIEAYEPPARPAVPVPPLAGAGSAATEAPRGVLFHRYELAADGTVVSARIVPPTAQNQEAMEIDLRRYVQDRLDLPDAQIAAGCEWIVRNYDPCISCATHFLTLTLDGSS